MNTKLIIGANYHIKDCTGKFIKVKLLQTSFHSDGWLCYVAEDIPGLDPVDSNIYCVSEKELAFVTDEMTKNKTYFTPAVWTVEDCRENDKSLNDYKIYSDIGYICTVENCNLAEEEANAYLIAKSPELYASESLTLLEDENVANSLRWCCGNCPRNKSCNGCVVDTALDVLLKRKTRILSLLKQARGEVNEQ